MVTLSIGIPVYNQVDTIATTIESILNQTIKPFEIIVCENHSTDGTREIVNRYADMVRIVSPPSHLSMAANWNYCVNACNGGWVGLCSGDDLLLSNYVNDIVSSISAYNDAVFVMGAWENFTDKNNIINPHYLLSVKKYTKYPDTLKLQLEGPKASFAAFAFSKAVFVKVGGYSEKYHLIQDWILQFDIAKYGSFIYTGTRIAKYRTSASEKYNEIRKVLYLKDYLMYLTDKIWEAEYHQVKMDLIFKSCKKILLRVMHFIIQNNISKQSEIVRQFTPIANKVKLKNWELFLNNKYVYKDRIGKTKKIIRFIINKLIK